MKQSGVAFAMHEMELVFEVCANPADDGRESSNPTADEAMDRYARGEDAAFAALYAALAPKLCAFILRKVRNSARAEDLVQATLVRIIAARARFVAGSRVCPWAFAILHHLYLDQIKRKRLEVPSDGCGGDEPASDQPGPEECADYKQRDELLRRAVASLPQQQRLVYELVAFEQLTQSEAAEMLGVTVAAVKLRLQRAKQALAVALISQPAGGAKP